MHIQILSDLHVEFDNAVPPLAPDADLVVMAGDFAPATQRRIGEAAKAWAAAGQILYVPGNHEFYGSDIDRAAQILAVDCQTHGVTLLNPGAVSVGHVRFIGATLWTDFRFDGAEYELGSHLAVRSGLTDFRGAIASRGVNLTTWETSSRHTRDRAFIEAELSAAREAGHVAVVITHHAPSPRCIHPKYEASRLNAGFASNLEELIREHEPALWIHGHVHNAVDVTVGRTRIIANPHGYGPAEARDFRPSLAIEV